MSTKTGRFELKLEDRSLITCFRDCWVIVTNYLYEIAPKRPHNGLPVLNVFGEVKKPSPVPITAEVLAGVWNALVNTDRGDDILMDIGTAIAQAREDYQLDEGIYPDIEQVSHTYPKVRALVEVYQAICRGLTGTFAYPIQGYEALSLDSIDVEDIEAKANTYLLHQEQVSMSMDDVLPSIADCGTAQELERLKQAPAKGQEMEELETIKKELESKAQALAEALGRIAELEQELAGLQAELEDATEEELDEGVDTPYTYIARQPKDRNRRMGMLVAIIERAEGAGLLEKQMNTQRLRWSEHYSNGQIAYFVARANSLLGIKARQHNATNWKVWSNLVAGLGDTQLKDGKATYSKRGGSDKPLGHESIDELFVSL